jgi:hypothetical protein
MDSTTWRISQQQQLGSGDQTPSSHTLGTFNSLFERGPYVSYAELFARGGRARATVYMALPGTWWWSGQRSTARYIATQASVQLQWRLNRNLSFFTEYAPLLSR